MWLFIKNFPLPEPRAMLFLQTHREQPADWLRQAEVHAGAQHHRVHHDGLPLAGGRDLLEEAV